MIVINEIIIYLLIGVIPAFIFVLFKTKSAEQALSWTAAISGLPFLFIQTISTLTGVKLGLFWIIPFLTVSLFLLYYMVQQKVLPRQDWKDFIGRILVGSVAGILWWIIGFWPNARQMRVYSDILWNVGNAAQFMHSFQIQDPHWFHESSLNYHFYSHRVLAGLGLVTGSDLLHIVLIMFSLVTTISIGILATAKEFRKSLLYGMIGVVLVFALRPTTKWGPNLSFMMHMTGWAGSTYIWTLPLTIGSILWWFRWDRIRYNYFFSDKRDIKQLMNPAIITLVIVTTITYSKASGALVFIGLEFISFIYSTAIFIRKKIFTDRFLTLTWYCVSLIALLLADLLFFHNIFSNTGGDYLKLSFGLEPQDTAYLNGNVLLAILAAIGLPVIFILLNRRPSKKQLILLFASLFNFALFLLLAHRSYSDFFFMFNSVVLGIFSVSVGLDRKLILRFVLSIVILSFSCIIFSSKGFNIKGFVSLISVGRKPAEVELYGPDFTSLSQLKKCILTQDMVVYPYEPDETFKLSAILQAKIWNESARFTDYAIPDAKETFNGYPETIDGRIAFTKKWVFDSTYDVSDQYKSIVTSFGYILVLSSDLPRLAARFNNAAIITCGKWSIVCLSSKK